MPEAFSNMSLATAYAAAIGYLLGSVPFGLILTKLAGIGDIRQVGSGSFGATNVLRTGRKGIAAVTVLLDVGKGWAAVLIAATVWNPDIALWAAIFSVLGHNFPVWLGFKGGKGVATSLGVFLGVQWPLALLCLATWLAIVIVSRISSLAALLTFSVLPLYAAWFAAPEVVWLAAFLAILGIARHHANIGRLLRGQESKIGSSG